MGALKLRFKTQAYQTEAVAAVVDCFVGQPPAPKGIRYRLDPGKQPAKPRDNQFAMPGYVAGLGQAPGEEAFRNADLALSQAALLQNLHEVQDRHKLPRSQHLAETPIAPVNLDIEMETGTGKTYCYIKTIFELHKAYGWSKFIIVVPSVAIREGAAKSLAITAEHFLEAYGRQARFFIYDSKQLHHLESFSSDAGINVMIINVQAFNATGKDNRRIYEELDDFQSRKPIDVISANRPILILDEPQKMEGAKTLDSLKAFKALMVLRYSATHKTEHNKVYRLDALDAYNQKLVKKIAVRGIATKGLAGTHGYLYLQGIEISAKHPPVARVEFEQKLAKGKIRRVVRKLKKGDNLFDESFSGGLGQYKQGYVVADINANTDTLSFTNGVELAAGEVNGDVSQDVLRRIQIREAIKAHLDKEAALFAQGIKVLSLFFIDDVAKYRDYDQPDTKGEYARIFEEEYESYRDEILNDSSPGYAKHLRAIAASDTHSGYFSIDKKTKRLANPTMEKRGESAGMSSDVDAYDLILKDKERLLSMEEPVRFIFSHSALREGWDNPNVFVICTLKQSDSTVSRRQEVGRGLRLAVNQQGERIDHPATVHDVNVLTVVANESYKDFVTALQKDVRASISTRRPTIDEAFLADVVIETAQGTQSLSPKDAKKLKHQLIKVGFIDDEDNLTLAFRDATPAHLAEVIKTGLPPGLPHLDKVAAALAERLRNADQADTLPPIADDRRAKVNPLNKNFERQEFKALWERINHKAAYTVRFDSMELVANAIRELDAQLRVTPLQYTIQHGQQDEQISYESLASGALFTMTESAIEAHHHDAHAAVSYDLIGEIVKGTALTRRTIAQILAGIRADTFEKFKVNPEGFIAEAIRIINEQKATTIVEHLAYHRLDEAWGTEIFTADSRRLDLSAAGDKLRRHIYDYVATDSKVERAFVAELDTSNEVVVYAKLPSGFAIPTPVGDYNPDWAISFKEGAVKHVYFVAETKGSLSSLDLRGIERTKIDCARRFFEQLSMKHAPEGVRYDVVDSYGKLMELVK